MRTIVIFIFSIIFSLFLNSHLWAEEPVSGQENQMKVLKEQLDDVKTKFETMQKEYQGQIKILEEKIDSITKSMESEQAKKQLETEIAKELPVTPAPTQVSTRTIGQIFNPDISVIGDFLGHLTDDETDENGDRFFVRELELDFEAAIDPYARGFVFLSASEEDGEWKMELEEAYASFLYLPLDTQAKLGKFKPAFGRVNQFHRHALPWVEYPNVITNYFGEEGISDAGVSLSALVPNPMEKYVELTLEAFNNENSLSFAGSEADDLVFLTHLKNFFDISEASTLELGLSYAGGPNDPGGSNITNLEGLDLTYKWRSPKEGLYKSFTSQTEFLFSQREGEEVDVDSWGMYSSLQYQFAKRWSCGGRYDYSEFPQDNTSNEVALSPVITFAQSEFAFWRLQYKHTDRNFGDDVDEIWLQLNFGMGPHRAHKY